MAKANPTRRKTHLLEAKRKHQQVTEHFSCSLIVVSREVRNSPVYCDDGAHSKLKPMAWSTAPSFRAILG